MNRMGVVKKFTGFAIAIAWPETYCRQSDIWYDVPLNFLGLGTHKYYRAGHAALVLVDSLNKKCHYFDFGRYHTPLRFGRVRSAKTDDGLIMKTSPVISDSGDKIENFKEIVTELQLNHECHGEGKLHASYGRIKFQKAYAKAKALQDISPIPYDPFKNNGTNCSRFVNSCIVAGEPKWFSKFRLKYLIPLTPTTLNNVHSLGEKIVLDRMLSFPAFYPKKNPEKDFLKMTQSQPQKHHDIPESAQWLSGEGSGSWFNIFPDKEDYRISRYNQDGDIECEGVFSETGSLKLDKDIEYRFVHLSHCDKVRINQNGDIIEFHRLS